LERFGWSYFTLGLPQRNNHFYISTERYALNVIALEKSGAMAFKDILKEMKKERSAEQPIGDFLC